MPAYWQDQDKYMKKYNNYWCNCLSWMCLRQSSVLVSTCLFSIQQVCGLFFREPESAAKCVSTVSRDWAAAQRDWALIIINCIIHSMLSYRWRVKMPPLQQNRLSRLRTSPISPDCCIFKQTAGRRLLVHSYVCTALLCVCVCVKRGECVEQALSLHVCQLNGFLRTTQNARTHIHTCAV